jgi:hypothetical protein
MHCNLKWHELCILCILFKIAYIFLCSTDLAKILHEPPLGKKILKFTPKYIRVGGEGGVSEFVWGVQSYSFGYSGLHAKIQNHRTTPSWRKVSE